MEEATSNGGTSTATTSTPLPSDAATATNSIESLPSDIMGARSTTPLLPTVSSPWTLGSTTEATTTSSSSSPHQSLYQDRLLGNVTNNRVAHTEAVLAAACEVMGFDIAEMWLRTGPKTHQLTHSHLRAPTAVEDAVRHALVDVYYGAKSSERTHRLSPALCKRAKESGDVVWVAADNPSGRRVLQHSISNVGTAVAVPICHASSGTNMTVIYFSMRCIQPIPAAMEFFVHLSLSAGVASIHSLAADGEAPANAYATTIKKKNLTQSEHTIKPTTTSTSAELRHHRPEHVSVSGASLQLSWRQLSNVEYLTDGGNSWIHTAVFNGTPVVVKTLKPECQDVAIAMHEMESELVLHARLRHPHVVALQGAGTTSQGVRFLLLERLDGGTLAQRLGYDTRIRDRRRRFWRRKQFSYVDVLRIGKAIAEAMTYLHETAIPGCVVLHRDLKPDNIGFTLDGTVKVFDFGLAKALENASALNDEVYTMSGETGSLRYMAPEVADGLPYNYKADVYSFGIILWELISFKKPFDGLNRELFYERIVHGGERPLIRSKWPAPLSALMQECWDPDIHRRPKFREIGTVLSELLDREKGGAAGNNNINNGSNNNTNNKGILPRAIGGIIDRHSSWF